MLGQRMKNVTLLRRPFHAAMSPLDSETHIRFKVNGFVFKTQRQTTRKNTTVSQRNVPVVL